MNRRSNNLLARVASHALPVEGVEPAGVDSQPLNRQQRRKLARMDASVQKQLASELVKLEPGQVREVALKRRGGR